MWRIMKECFEAKQHKNQPSERNILCFFLLLLFYLTVFLLPEDIFGIICSLSLFSFPPGWRETTLVKHEKNFRNLREEIIFDVCEGENGGISKNPIFLAVFNLNELLGSSFLLTVRASSRLRFPLDFKTHSFISPLLFVHRIFLLFRFLCFFLRKKSNWLFVRVSLVASLRVEFELWFDFRVIQESTKTFRSVSKRMK